MKSGILKIDKPSGPTSHDVVERVRRLTSIKRVGHAGTLDPFATGLLLIGIGKGTRLLEYLTDCKKTYDAVAKLGTITDTFDRDGELVEENQCTADEVEVESALKSFVGYYDQVPPMYSSKKYNGVRLYKLAREGKIVNMPPKRVKIYSLEVVEINLPYVHFIADVSKGTYIRALCRDLGMKLGCGAIAYELRRTRIGQFEVNDSIDAYSVERVDDKDIMSLEKITESFFPTVVVNEQGVKNMLNGQPLKVEDLKEFDEFSKGEMLRVINSKGKLISLSIGERKSDFILTLRKLKKNEVILRPKKVFN